MTERNKLSLTLFAKLFALLIWIMVTIAACSGNWNWNPERFVEWCSVILILMTIAAIFIIGYVWVKAYHAEIEAIQKRERKEFENAAKK